MPKVSIQDLFAEIGRLAIEKQALERELEAAQTALLAQGMSYTPEEEVTPDEPEDKEG